ncbi:MAG: porin [Bacillota bacterium]
MMKKVSIVLAIVMFFALSAPVMASPFKDVPADHWAYDAIQEVSKAGIVTGYEDNTFKGDKKLTRYEMAVIAARISSQVEDQEVSDEVRETVKALTNEFGQELANLEERVTDLEDKGLNVKVSGEASTIFTDTNLEGNPDLSDNGQYWNDWDDTLDDDAPAVEEFKEELDFNIQTIIDDSTTATLTLDTITDGFGDYVNWKDVDSSEDSKQLSLDDALLEIENPAYGLRIGDLEDYHLTNYFYDEEDVEGVEATTNLFDTQLSVFKGQDDDTSDAQDLLSIEAARKIAGIDLTGQYLEADEQGIYGVTAGSELLSDVDSQVKYYALDNSVDDNYLVDGQVSTEFGDINTTIGYKQVGANFNVDNDTFKADDDIYGTGEDYEPGIEGIRVTGAMDLTSELNIFGAVESEELNSNDIFTTEVGAEYAVDETTTLSGSYELANTDNDADVTTINAGLEGNYLAGKLATTVDYELEDKEAGVETSTLEVENEYAVTDTTTLVGNAHYETKDGSSVDSTRTYYDLGANHQLTENTSLGVNYRVLDFDDQMVADSDASYQAESIRGEFNVQF